YYWQGHPDYVGSTTIAKDDLPASAYIERFKVVANKINRQKNKYNWKGYNSNSVARTLIQVGLGIDISDQLGRSYGGLLGWRYILLPKPYDTAQKRKK